MENKIKDSIVMIWLVQGFTFAIATLVNPEYWIYIWICPLILFVIGDIIYEIIKYRRKP
jgi:hypothetical protein